MMNAAHLGDENALEMPEHHKNGKRRSLTASADAPFIVNVLQISRNCCRYLLVDSLGMDSPDQRLWILMEFYR
ncbi:hypothetical protein U9M48_019390 [Paspalum notatum var. saurae]|uniref:Uncharacterized protein n=1 Tax=Paspalum notatum var. saurae TaxID=547442 RepID=A0AAQ3TEX5_PASNO